MARAGILKKRSAMGARVRGAMPVERVFLLLCLVLESLMPSGHCGSPRHSLRYSYLKVSEPTQGLPRSLIVTHLDDEPIAQYDTRNGKTVPLVPWMEAEEVKMPERIFRSDLEWLSNLNWTGGLHTWQVNLGCELREDGSKGGFLHYGYNGMDFISFDMKNLTWVAPHPQAVKVKEKWEEDPRWSQGNKSFLEETCIVWLQRYLSYRNKTLQRTELPVGKVTRKMVNDSLEVLICQAVGFYPKEIQATWTTRDGEHWEQETLRKNVAPNSDGTYYVQLSIEIDPKVRDLFRCHLEHKGLPEPLVLAWKKETGFSRHSLRYLFLKVSEPNQELPQFLSVTHLDDEPIARYDTHTGKTVPLVPWMEAEEVKMPERIFRSDLEWLSNLNWTGGLHTWQVNLGCELREDGSKGGFLHYGYNGMDFISFDMKNLTWVAPHPQAVKVKEKWEEDPRWSQGNKSFLEETCIVWLQRYLSYRNKTLQRTELPVGKVTRKMVNDSLEVLICQAVGFYPKEIQATWTTRDGEHWEQETLRKNVAPNSDGTYYVQLSIEINPKERDLFRCHLEHKGLPEPLVLAWKEETDIPSFPLVGTVVVIIIILAFVILILIGCSLIYRKKLHQAMKTCLDHFPSENVHSSPTCDIENEIQSQVMLPAKVTSEGCCGQKRGKGPSEEQADELLAGEEMGETQL